MFTEMIYYGRLSMIEIALSRHAPPKKHENLFSGNKNPRFWDIPSRHAPPKNTKTFFPEIRTPVLGT